MCIDIANVSSSKEWCRSHPSSPDMQLLLVTNNISTSRSAGLQEMRADAIKTAAERGAADAKLAHSHLAVAHSHLPVKASLQIGQNSTIKLTESKVLVASL